MSNTQGANSFALDLVRKGLSVRKRTTKEISRIIQNLFTNIVIKTPVDKGIARGNWNLSLGTPDESFSDQRKDQSGSNTIDKGNQNLADFNLGKTVYITNSTVYIRRLEDGHSNQAPNGWVKTAIERTRRRLK